MLGAPYCEAADTLGTRSLLKMAFPKSLVVVGSFVILCMVLTFNLTTLKWTATEDRKVTCFVNVTSFL